MSPLLAILGLAEARERRQRARRKLMLDMMMMTD